MGIRSKNGAHFHVFLGPWKLKMTYRLQPDQLEFAATLLKAGHLVAFPTETVYGLGANIFLPEAIENVFQVKGRPSDNPLIAHVSSMEQIQAITQELPLVFFRLMESFFPGPLTIVVKRDPSVTKRVSAGMDTIAIRMPSHSIAKQLIALAGSPLVAPSANLSGKPSATQAEHVLEDFEGKIAAVVDGGKTEIGIESTVISLVSETPLLLRPGVISKERLEQVLETPLATQSFVDGGPLLSPGLKYRHYCPSTPLKLFYSVEEVYLYLTTRMHNKTMFLSRRPLLHLSLSHVTSFTLCAEDFYALLRLADKQHYDEIVIFCDLEVQQESGLMNRILRAYGKER